MTCDMFIWEASKEWASDLAEMIKFPGTCREQNSLCFSIIYVYFLKEQEVISPVQFFIISILKTIASIKGKKTI